MTKENKKELLQFAAALENAADLFYSLSDENKQLLEDKFCIWKMKDRIAHCGIYADDIRNIVKEGKKNDLG